MREMTLQEQQRVCFEILEDVHIFCEENNIRYSLIGGSLLGAIRHQGFIPWDDDIDVGMPRPDYERFCRTYKSENYKVLSPYIGNSRLNFGRVCEMRKTYVEAYCPWTDEITGVWIDVFPIDGTTHTKESLVEASEAILKLDSKLYQIRGTYDIFAFKKGVIKNFKILAKKILYGRFSLLENMEKYWKLVGRADFESSSHCGQYGYPGYITKEYLDTNIFKEYVKVRFCGKEVYAVKEYDILLRNYFGDYMKLPPEKDRVPAHNSNKLYFK